MGKLTRSVWPVTIGFVLGIGMVTGKSVFAERSTPGEPLPLEDLQIFSEVFGKIKSDYVEEVTDTDLLRGAIEGMLSGLDPHSTYLDPESFQEVQIGTEGRFGGLGLEVTMESGFVKVVTPIDDTPASEAGILPGDVIVRLDDTPIKGMTLTEAVKLMRGEPGTEIRLTISREGESKPLVITLVRSVIRITSVKSRVLEDRYAYVRISQFQSGTADALRKSLRKVTKQAGGSLDGLVLDLRNNPGGVLNGAVAVSDAFLSRGVIVYTKGRQQESELRFNADSADFIDGAPMVVLVNGGSASASEIVAGALQDHKRAVIMGSQTFGKGSVQTILPMKNGAALKMTTALYYTPNDRSIQATGIEPDIKVEALRLSAADPDGDDGLREADLSGHLGNGNGDSEAGASRSSGGGIGDDYQLRAALDMLKGMNVLRSANG